MSLPVPSIRRPLLPVAFALSTLAALFASGASAATPDSGWVEFDSFSYEGHDPLFEQAPPTATEFYNPILAGFYPDPSICRVGDDFYLVNSTFSYFPGVPIFHSRDLVNWTQLGHVLDRPSQLDLDGQAVSDGIFAPTIAWHAGVFYMITTNVRGIGNFYVTAKDPAGPWSEPVRLSFNGIDPSFFFDDDGKIYVVHNGPPPGDRALYDGHRAIWLWEFDPATRAVKNGRILVNGGVDLAQKPVWVEGPHLFKRNGYYFLCCAEGGTADQHSQVIFRTKSLSEPVVPGPRNPILTQRDIDRSRPNPVTALGHADLVETARGEWWAVFLGIRPYESGRSNLGRETFLLPVAWQNDWPVILEKGRAMPVVAKRPALPASPRPASPTTGSFTWRDDFDSATLGLPWLFLRTPRERWWSLSARPGALLIEPRPVPLTSVPRHDPEANRNPSFIARRLQHVDFQAATALEIQPATLASDAGLAALQNDTNYLFLGVRIREGRARELFLERRVKSSTASEILAQELLPANARHLELRMEGAGNFISFAYRVGEGAAWQTLASRVAGPLNSQDAGGFVGATVGLYARLPVEAAPLAAAPVTPAPVAAVEPSAPARQLGEIKVLALAASAPAPWAANFADGAPTLAPWSAFGPRGPLANDIAPDSGILQTFRGNGQKLRGAGFFLASASAPRDGAKFTLALLDYGATDPTQNLAGINGDAPVLATADFTWSSSSDGRQYYFDLSSADLMLAPDRHYGIALRFTKAIGANVVLRSMVDALPEGRLAFGRPGAYTFDFAGGDRDVHFALYTKQP